MEHLPSSETSMYLIYFKRNYCHTHSLIDVKNYFFFRKAGTENRFEIRVFKVKNDWNLRVKVTKKLENGIEFSIGDLYRIKDDNTEEKVKPLTLKNYKCDDEEMRQKILKCLEVVKAFGEAVGACTSAARPFLM